MNFYTQLAIEAIVISLGLAYMFYDIALVSGGEPEFMAFFRNTLLVVGGFAISWGGIYRLVKQLEISSDSPRDRL